MQVNRKITLSSLQITGKRTNEGTKLFSHDRKNLCVKHFTEPEEALATAIRRQLLVMNKKPNRKSITGINLLCSVDLTSIS